MFRTERQTIILEELARVGRVSTTELAQRFGVSEDSIRKDLQRLSADGLIQRVYGGAVSLDDTPDRNVTARVDAYRPQKQQIAQKAYDLIQNDQTIYLDVSSTNLYLADLLAKGEKHVIVVSTMLDVIKRVAAGKNVIAQCPGGKMDVELNGFVGATTLSVLQDMCFDLAFLGALGANVEDDAVTVFDMEDGVVKRTVLHGATKAYVLADAHKFHAHGNYRYAGLSDFTGVITDDAGVAYADAIRKLGIELL